MAFNMKGTPTNGAPKQSSGLNLFRKGRGKEYRKRKKEVVKALKDTGTFGDFTGVDLSGHHVGPGSRTAIRRGARAFVKQELGIEDGKVNWKPGATGVFTTKEAERPGHTAHAHANAKPGGVDIDLDISSGKFVKSEAKPVIAGTKDQTITKTVKGEDVVTPHSFKSTDLDELKTKVEELKSDPTVSAIKKDDAEINQMGFRMKGWSGFTQMSIDEAKEEKKKKENEGFTVVNEDESSSEVTKDPLVNTTSTTTNIPLEPFGSYDQTDTKTTEKKFTGEKNDNVYIDLQKEIDSGFAKKKGFGGTDVKEYEKWKISGADYKGPTETITTSEDSSGEGTLNWNVTTPGEDKVVEETIKGTPGSIGEGIVHEGNTFGVDIDVDAKKKEKVKCGPGEKKDDNGNCVPRRVDEEVTVEKKKSGMKKVCTNWEWVEKGSGMGAKRKDAGPRPTETITKTRSVRNV